MFTSINPEKPMINSEMIRWYNISGKYSTILIVWSFSNEIYANDEPEENK